MTNPGPLSWIEVRLDAIEHNLNALRALTQAPNGTTQKPAVCAVIKKNAYGLGAVPIAHRLMRQNVDMFAVYSPDEAETLVAQAVTTPILLLAPLRELNRTDTLYRHAVAEKLHVSIHDEDQLKAVNALGHTFGIRFPIQPYIDTGMSRSGLSIDQFTNLARRISDYKFVRITGLFTHMATADNKPDFTTQQLDRFEAALADVAETLPDNIRLHAANTFACFRDTRYHLDMIRPGLGLFGFGPEWLEPGPVIADAPTLQPAARWLSSVTHVQRYKRQTPVGYGSTERLKRDSVLGIVPVGYADGYPVALSKKGTLRIQSPTNPDTWTDARVLGKVNMDQLTIDLTDAAADLTDPNQLLNATAEIYGNNPSAPNHITTLARQAKTNTYELLTRLAPQLPRKHIN